MSVNRCVCHRRSFRELLAECQQHAWSSLDDLAHHTGVGTGCGSCRPYLAAMLATKNTHFAVAQLEMTPQPCAPEPWEA